MEEETKGFFLLFVLLFIKWLEYIVTVILGKKKISFQSIFSLIIYLCIIYLCSR